jgi:hypothetical protein
MSPWPFNLFRICFSPSGIAEDPVDNEIATYVTVQLIQQSPASGTFHKN